MAPQQPSMRGPRRNELPDRGGEPVEEPQEWFHDIFRADHTPHDTEEMEFIKRTCTAMSEPPGREGPSIRLTVLM